MVSSSAPTCISALTVAVKPAVRAIPSRLNVLKPGSVKVTEYVPGPQIDDVVPCRRRP